VAVTNETIIVDSGAEFTVTLQSAQGAGYVWQLQAHDGALRLLASGQQALDKVAQGSAGAPSAPDAPDAPGAPGAPGATSAQFFRWSSLQPGRHFLSFVLKRPWEAQPIETHQVTVEVRQAHAAPRPRQPQV
jgi:predicted secreted protein